MNTPPVPDLPGLKYIEKLGAGGFSDVYLYERDQPRIKVAVKLLRSDILDDAQRRQFVAEADVMAELADHPFIVPVLGAGTAPDNRPYLVMRYYPPPDLGARVASEPLSVPDALRTGIQLASAIETAHRAGIIHRDIKPSNILVSTYGVPGLSDFGIAGRAADGDEDDEHLGVSMPWSPPEVLTGASNGSAASDIYSLGATIWNLLVGRSPFTIKGGDNSERSLFARIVHSKPPTTGRADVPGSLDRLLQQAMAKSPDHRPQSAMELARHLQRVEQELRLARTEIVVLENRQPAAAPTLEGPPPGATQLRPGTPEVPAAPATRQRAVSRVEAAQPTVQPAAAPTNDAATAYRPARAVAPQGSPNPAQGSPATRQRNVQRVEPAPAPGPVFDDSVPASTTELPAPQGRGRLVAGGVVAALLVTAIGVGVLLSGGGKDPNTKSTLPPSGANTDLGTITGGDGTPTADPPAAPQPHGEKQGSKIVFTWPQEQKGDTYRWVVANTGGALSRPSAKRLVQIAPQPDSTGRTCLFVFTVRKGVPSEEHGQACFPRS